jgi:glycosyltransferase involved in cell wall biosynthesis
LAIVNQHLTEALSTVAAVRRFDVSGGSVTGDASALQRARRVVPLLATAGQLCRSLLRDRPNALVIGSSGGAAMLFDATVSLLATIARVPVHIYHHSFACLNAPTTRWYHRIGLRLMRNRQHVVLCEHMRNVLAQQHDIAASHISVVSNAAYVPPTTDSEGKRDGDTPCVGFLSAVQASKGIFEFLDLVVQLRRGGHPVTALVAGPLDTRIAKEFRERLAQFGHAHYLGVVNEIGKTDFFRKISLLVLPTRFVHESEPMVVIESLSHAVPVLTTRRGCLPSAWGRDANAVHILDETEFVDQARAVLAPWLASHAVRSEWSRAARSLHGRMRTLALAQLHEFVHTLTGRGAIATTIRR